MASCAAGSSTRGEPSCLTIGATGTIYQMKTFKNSVKPSIKVQIIDEDAEIRIGEMKVPAVAYVREGRKKVSIRTKEEFRAKFVKDESES